MPLRPIGHDQVLPAVEDVGLDLALGGPLDAGVVPAAQSAIGGDGDVARRRDRLATGEQRRVRPGAGGGKVADDLGDLLRVGHGGGDALLRLDDPRRGDQLHRPRDLLRRLDAADATPQDPLLPTSHNSAFPGHAGRVPALRWPPVAYPRALRDARIRSLRSITPWPGSWRTRPRRPRPGRPWSGRRRRPTGRRHGTGP